MTEVCSAAGWRCVSRVAIVKAVCLALAFGLVSLTTAQAIPQPVIVSATTATIEVNQSFNYQIILANFAQGTYGAVNLPDGLALDAKVGAISGSPKTAGEYNITLTATNDGGTGQANLQLTVLPVVPPTITSDAAVTGEAFQPFSFQVVADNLPRGYAASDLPPGLSIDPATGLISGTPSDFGIFNATVTATNIRGSTSAALALSIAAEVPVITVTAAVSSAYPDRGQKGRFVVKRLATNLIQPVRVTLALKGNAKNGVNYYKLPTQVTIKPGKTSRSINVSALPGAEGETGSRTVKLVIVPADTYRMGDKTTAKVKIFYVP